MISYECFINFSPLSDDNENLPTGGSKIPGIKFF